MSTELIALVALLVINMLSAWYESASEKKLEESSPRFKACMDLLKGIGIDPPKVFAALTMLLKGGKK